MVVALEVFMVMTDERSVHDKNA